MTTVDRALTPRPRLALALAFAELPIPVLGWIAAQTLPDRIVEPSEFTGAYVHALGASVFAVILFASAVINAGIVLRRVRDRPLSYRLSRYPLWQAIVIVLGVGWLACVILGGQDLVEIALAGVIAVASIVACVFGSRKDEGSTERRAQRLAAARAAHKPETARRVRFAKIAVPVAVAVLAVGGLVIAQSVVVVHRSCVIVGTGDVNGQKTFYTENCGDFAVDESRISSSDLDRAFSRSGVDVTTRGYEFGIPPLPVAVTLEPPE